MKSFKLNKGGSIYWFSKEPKCFEGVFIQFNDGENAIWPKHLHREDGPAIECPNGAKFWYWHGEQAGVSSQEEFETWKRFRNFL